MTRRRVRGKLRWMTPDDFAALLKWRYANNDGSGWLPAAARDMRIAERNLRGMLQGKLPISEDLWKVTIMSAAAFSLLDRFDLAALEIGTDCRRRLESWRRQFDHFPP